MLRVILGLVISVFLSTTLCYADLLIRASPVSDAVPMSHLKQTTSFQYGSIHFQHYADPVLDVSFTPDRSWNHLNIPFLVSTAQASIPPPSPLLQDFAVSYQTILNATQLNDLVNVTSERFLQNLNERTSHTGGDERAILAMIQALRPLTVEVLASKTDGDEARLLVYGQSVTGPTHGMIVMKKSDPFWRIDSEQWLTGRNNHLNAKERLLSSRMIDHPLPGEKIMGESFENFISVDIKIRRRALPLQNVNPLERKEALMFTFMMNPHKDENEHNAISKDRDKDRHHLHIIWPGVDDILPEPKVFKKSLPIDVSIADDSEGYMPGELNLRLPKKKVKEITAGIIWNF